MKKIAKKTGALEVIKKLEFQIEVERPSRQQMMEEVKMMGFKIRSVAGDLAALAQKDAGLIETLWRIGKINEIINTDVQRLSIKDREIFSHFLNSKQGHLEEKSLALSNHSSNLEDQVTILEVEVSKTTTGKTRLN